MRSVHASRTTDQRRTAIDAGAAAWLAVIPTTAIAIAAIVLLGPPLGDALLPHAGGRFWSSLAPALRPEPTEQARYLIALTAPLLLAGLTVLLVRRGVSQRVASRSAHLARWAELIGIAGLAACFVAARALLPPAGTPGRTVYFTTSSLLVAACLTAGIAAGVRSGAIRRRWTHWTTETRARRGGATLVALLAIAVALLPAINTDATIANELEGVIYHLQFTYDETFAVLDGRSPLGDFAAQYASLWPYALAGAMSLLGSSLAVFTGLMATLAGGTLLALYDVLRRAARSSLAALALFLPLVATFGWWLAGSSANRFSIVTYFAMLPLRYAGPFLLAWLVARHLDGARPRRVWPLFLAGGLVALNNADFGIAALGATLAALLWTRPHPDAVPARRQALEALAGLALAAALVTALLLARTGSPPDLSLLLVYARLFGVDGFSMSPIEPVVGVQTAIFLTYVAAIAVATVRSLRGNPDRLLTGMLVWSGVFGLGAAAYYVGQSSQGALKYMFPPWAFAVTLLALTAIREAAGRWPRPAELACMLGLGLVACSLAQLPAPWLQAKRLAASGPHLFAIPPGQSLVAQSAQAGEPVLIVSTLGHRIAYNLGLSDVERFTGPRSILTAEQLDESLAALRAAGETKVFVLLPEARPGLTEALEAGYRLRARSEEGMELWVAR